MKSIVYQIAKANFLERARRTSFIMAMALTVILGYFFLPTRGGSYVTLVFGHYVGKFNSAWMGASMAMSVEVFFGLIGFFLVSNAIGLDGETKVGQLIIPARVSKTSYLLGKFWSNYAMLAVITFITMITAVVMQLIRGESYAVNVWAYLGPFLLLVLPFMAMVSVIALIFEVIPWFRNTLGTVVFFFFWIFTTIGFAESATVVQRTPIGFTDPLGQKIAEQSMVAALKQQHPHYNGQFSNGFTQISGKVQTFVWNGIHWTPAMVVGRLLWIVIAVLLVVAASFAFRRSHIGYTRKAKARKQKKQEKFVTAPSVPNMTATSLTPLKTNQHTRFLPVLLAELKLTYAGQRWWYLGIIPATVLSFVLPVNAVRDFVWPIALIWPLALWSAMGVREKQNGTEELVYSSPKSMSRLLPSSWLAGISLSVLMTFGAAIRFGIAGHSGWLLAWAVGAVFIPSLALALGVWSGSARLFQILYLVLWYGGPLNKFGPLNFLNAQSVKTTYVYLVALVVLCFAAYIGRQRKLQER